MSIRRKKTQFVCTLGLKSRDSATSPYNTTTIDSMDPSTFPSTNATVISPPSPCQSSGNVLRRFRFDYPFLAAAFARSCRPLPRGASLNLLVPLLFSYPDVSNNHHHNGCPPSPLDPLTTLLSRVLSAKRAQSRSSSHTGSSLRVAPPVPSDIPSLP